VRRLLFYKFMEIPKETVQTAPTPGKQSIIPAGIRQNAIWLLLAAWAVAGLLTIIFFDGTGDNGDSIFHYLFARYAPLHPRLFLNHWAKPLFVLISSPFAQFGFTGMKVFNLSLVMLTGLVTFRTAICLDIKNPLLSVVFLIFAPLYYILTFSGLTEPLFAFSLILAIYLAINNKIPAAVLIISFLPFIRSEGLIIIMVFAIYLAWKKQWKYLPLLVTGHVVYSLAGYFAYHDLLWVFNKLPYANLEHKHGSGPLLHFVYQLNYVIGIPLYFMLCLGFISYPLRWIWNKTAILSDETLLVLFCFLSYFAAHSLFWYLGIFNSMGLKRVLLGVIPLISLIALQGFNFATLGLFPGRKLARNVIGVLLISYLIIFPFTKNPASILWSRDMKLTNEQKTAKGIAAYIKEHPIAPGNRYFYTYPYLNEVLHVDPFDSLRRLDLTPWFLLSARRGDVVIWDNWFAVIESYSPVDSVAKQPGLKREIDFDADDNHRAVKFVIFRKE